MSLIRRIVVALLPVTALVALIAVVVFVGGCERDRPAAVGIVQHPALLHRRLAFRTAALRHEFLLRRVA